MDRNCKFVKRVWKPGGTEKEGGHQLNMVIFSLYTIIKKNFPAKYKKCNYITYPIYFLSFGLTEEVF